MPPKTAPYQDDGNTHSAASFKFIALRIANPVVLNINPRAAPGECTLSPVMNGSLKALTRQKPIAGGNAK
jgi:hypothetical protein